MRYLTVIQFSRPISDAAFFDLAANFKKRIFAPIILDDPNAKVIKIPVYAHETPNKRNLKIRKVRNAKNH
jgi:hypothetical protein